MAELIEEVIVAWVEDISGLVPYPAKLEQTPALPGVTYQLVTAPESYTQDGPTGKVSAMFQLNIWDSTYLGAVSTAKAIKQGINGFRGEKYGIKIDSVMVSNAIDGREDATDRHRRILDVTIKYKEVN